MSVIERINKLKKERNAVILVHNYQLPEVQDIADFTGDSLGLSIQAAQTEADVIVFCGVYFMAETAKILSPEKTIIIPDESSGCPMAEMITVAELRELKSKHPNAKTMCYVNTYADVKAECDYCCTSANAEMMLTQVFSEDDEIIFVPDKYLASYAANRTGRNVILWHGFCASHARILPEFILEQKKLHPEAKVMSHPECRKEVLDISDAVLSTSGMLKYAKEADATEFVVGTEIGMCYPLKKENPSKEFYPATEHALCENMKKITLDKVVSALENLTDEVVLSDEIIRKAKLPIDRMIAVGRQEADLRKTAKV